MELAFRHSPRPAVINSCVAAMLCGAVLATTTLAQGNRPSPPPSAPTLPPMPNLPPGIGAQPDAPDNPPSAAPMPGAPAGAGPHVPPPMNEPPIFPPRRDVPIQSTISTPTGLISFLDSTTPFVQAFDCVLMLCCGFYCLRSNTRAKSGALKLMALACFISAIILLGFFLSATFHNHMLFASLPRVRVTAYLVARLLAPFELLLFAAAIVLVARRSG